MKKRGARIKNTLALKPLGIRNMIAYELPTRAAIVAVDAGDFNSTNIAHLYSLGDMCQRIAKEVYILRHAEAVCRIASDIHSAGHCDAGKAQSLTVSSNLLLDWLLTQSNKQISDAAQGALREFG